MCDAQRYIGHHVDLLLDTDMAELILRGLDLGLVEDDDAAPHQAMPGLHQLAAWHRFAIVVVAAIMRMPRVPFCRSHAGKHHRDSNRPYSH